MKKILCSVFALAALTLGFSEMPAQAAKRKRPARSGSIDRQSNKQGEVAIDRSGICPESLGGRIETYESYDSGSSSRGFNDYSSGSGGYNGRGESF